MNWMSQKKHKVLTELSSIAEQNGGEYKIDSLNYRAEFNIGHWTA